MVGGRVRITAWGAGVCLLLAGCDPEIYAFEVQPTRACAGDSVHISWKVRGTPHLVTLRRSDDSGDIIRYTLIAESRGKQASRAVEVLTYIPGVPALMVGGADILGKDSLVARDSARTAPWHSLVRVGDVVSDSGRALRVRHGGREGLIGPGRQASQVWRGQPVGGVWEMFSGLERGEVIGHPKRHPPASLSLKVGLECAGRVSGP